MGMLIANWKKKLKESYESVVDTKAENTKSDENVDTTETTEKPKRGRKKKEEN